ncbi:hypothetical protein EVAR_7963_1 [Eumeta japonica]|uniref:Reverse transcriptase domain-containing protein n=1 Tax=Eumeta variegata TaxID=151549 RepID=A0A4C1THX8_EUMVA|nr:hypothetical protein EVAR_7963_1 [Eumeta japonica]
MRANRATITTVGSHTELKDRTSMQRELMAYSYKKRTNSDRASNEPAKRSKQWIQPTRVEFRRGLRYALSAEELATSLPQCSDRRASPSLAARSSGAEKPSTAEHRRVDAASSRCRRSSHLGTPTGALTQEIEIKLIDPNRTVQRRPYRLSPDERQVCRDKIKDLLAANIIRPSCSPFASPILLVKKKDGSDRLCVDYSELNRNTVPDKFPLPLISDQIQRLKGANYFTILDAASGFHQIPVHKDSIERTAFVTPDGQYEYLTMPFGLRNAPSVFQRAMHKALGDLVNTFVVCYLDDMMIVSDNEKEGLET